MEKSQIKIPARGFPPTLPSPFVDEGSAQLQYEFDEGTWEGLPYEVVSFYYQCEQTGETFGTSETDHAYAMDLISAHLASGGKLASLKAAGWWRREASAWSGKPTYGLVQVPATLVKDYPSAFATDGTLREKRLGRCFGQSRTGLDYDRHTGGLWVKPANVKLSARLTSPRLLGRVARVNGAGRGTLGEQLVAIKHWFPNARIRVIDDSPNK